MNWVLIGWLVLGQTEPAAIPVPLATETLDIAARRGLSQAIREWHRKITQPAEDASKMLEDSLAKAETYRNQLGRERGYEIAGIEDISEDIQHVYGIVKCEKGPIYVCLKCYRRNDGWGITSYLFCDHIEHVFPERLLQ